MIEGLTDQEQKLFDLLQSKKGKNVSLDDLTKKHPDRNRQGTIQILKYLAAKIAQHGWIIKRETPIGRGNKGEYSMKKFGE